MTLPTVWIDENTISCAARGERRAIRILLTSYGRSRNWSAETLRCRLDGAYALASWQRQAMKDPIENITHDQARAYAQWLQDKGLKPSTIRAYIKGSKNLYFAIFRARGSLPPLEHPFRGVTRKKLSTINSLPASDLLSGSNPKLRALLALKSLGLSTAAATRLTWQQVNLTRAVLQLQHSWGEETVPLSPSVCKVLAELPVREGRVIAWSVDHARRCLKAIESKGVTLGKSHGNEGLNR